MDEMNAPAPMAAPSEFEGHPTQAHADHAAIMKAHGVISNPHRMAAVHALHQAGGGLMEYLKKKQKDFSAKSAGPEAGPAHAETPEADQDADMAPKPVMSSGKKQSAEM